mmetsp:Transcript_128087/g.304112  ORF Transcript_128087/g.304112 Transcript_128087/m.304112 type:complete len:165 (-) Transcript_128087:44-538(-)
MDAPQVRSIIIDQGADDSLHRAERALQWILSEGQGVLLVFVVVYGDGSDADGEWLKLTRGLLSLEQPVYGIAIGAMSDASLALLEACDCVFSSLPQPTACRLLHPVEIATVCEIIGTETSGMGFQEIKVVKERLRLRKLRTRFPALAKDESAGAEGLERCLIFL